MANGPRTLIIGDEEAMGLFNALKRLPKALDPGPIWLRARGINPILWWSDHPEYIKAALDEIANPKNGSPPDRPIDTILIALGRLEILTEPDGVEQKDIDLVVGDALTLIKEIKALAPAGKPFRIMWVMPLFAKNEGKTRAALDAALRKAGVAMIPTIYSPRESLQDPTKRGESPEPIPDATWDLLARLVQAAVPLRAPKPTPAPGPIVPPQAEPAGGAIAEAYAASVEAVGGLSRGTKIAAGAFVVLALGVGISYATRGRR